MDAVQEPALRSPVEDLAQVAHDAKQFAATLRSGIPALYAPSRQELARVVDLIERLASASLALGK